VGVVALVGLLVTALAAWTAWRTDRSNERTLLAIQTKQAAEVLGAAITGIADPLRTATVLADATEGDAARLRAFLEQYVRPGGLFVDASVWRAGGRGSVPVVAVGGAARMSPASAAGRAFVAEALAARTFVVRGLYSGPPQRVAYALAGSGPARYVVYAERAIPANRRVPAEDDAAFAELHFASYLGPRVDPAALSTTDVDPARLPLTGLTARASIPFGDTTLTLVTSPARHLGGQLAARLPWIFLTVGLVLTTVAAATAGLLVRRRRAAETDARTITELYEQLDASYDRQRSVSLRLQHALLPQSIPDVAGVEFAAAYRAGDEGVDVGGDWYSVIALPGGRFGFVVGDVSGRGVDAAAIMARARFTLRAYLLEGHAPAAALAMMSQDLDMVRDGHLVTVLVGVGDPARRTVTWANAGHLPPLVVDAGGARFAAAADRPPLGVAPGEFAETTLEMAPGALLVAFTDGLVERRTEDIDAGLGRLAAAARVPEGALADWLPRMLAAQLGDGPATDDVAVLALRWAGGRSAPAVAADRDEHEEQRDGERGDALGDGRPGRLQQVDRRDVVPGPVVPGPVVPGPVGPGPLGSG
jgi:serine phosphatase RsbU (regulator of sigma subunit)